MKMCSVCGKDFADENEYCDFCGIKLDVVEGDAVEESEEQVEEEQEIDVDDGSCGVCGTVNPENAKFCMSCAAKLEEEESERKLTLILPGGKEVVFTGDRMVFGREDFEDILPEDKLKFLSRRGNPDKPDKFHFSIFRDGSEYFVIDEDSSNNTWLRGKKLRGEGEVLLESGDEIKPANEVSIDVIIDE